MPWDMAQNSFSKEVVYFFKIDLNKTPIARYLWCFLSRKSSFWILPSPAVCFISLSQLAYPVPLHSMFITRHYIKYLFFYLSYCLSSPFECKLQGTQNFGSRYVPRRAMWGDPIPVTVWKNEIPRSQAEQTLTVTGTEEREYVNAPGLLGGAYSEGLDEETSPRMWQLRLQ